MPVKFKTKLLKFHDHGDKRGWTYILIDKVYVKKLKDTRKKAGKLSVSHDLSERGVSQNLTAKNTKKYRRMDGLQLFAAFAKTFVPFVVKRY